MIELTVVVVIVGTLAAIAIPIYGKYMKNARLTEATGRIGEIVTAAKAYAQEHHDPATGDPLWPTEAGGIVDLSATPNFTYDISATNPATTGALVITATGQNQMGGPPAVTATVTIPTIYANATAPVIANL
jgi:type IV pilus assembly protein PilE